METKKVKAINLWNFDDKSKDEAIEMLIPHYASIASEYCNQDFTVPYPAKVEEFIAKMIAYHNKGLASRSMGSVSYSYDNDHEKKLFELIKPFRKVKWGAS